MRIFQIINSGGLDRGGAERLARELHLDLRRAGLEAYLLGLEAYDTNGVEPAASLGLKSPYDPVALPRLGKWLRERVRKDDVLHAHLFPTSLYVSTLRLLSVINAPCLFTEHNTLNRRRGHLPGRAIDRLAYFGFDRIVAISGGVRDNLTMAHPRLRNRTTIVSNGCVLRFDSMPEREPSTCPLILSVGRLERQKNYDTALKALAGLASQPFRYIVLGEGAERAALRSQATELGLSDRVEFLGHVADIQPWLVEADLFLMPSRWEGFGLAAVEAMNAGLPVIAADVPGLREVTGPDGVCARLVRPDDVVMLKHAVAALLQSSDQRKRLGRAAHQRAKLFGKERMTSAYITLYREVQRASKQSSTTRYLGVKNG